MADIDTQYIKVEDGVESQPVSSGRGLKVGITLFFGSLALLAIAAQSTQFHVTSAAESTNLVALSPVSRLPSGFTKPMGTPVLPGSSPLTKIAMPAREAFLQRDVKVRHGGDWDDMPPEVQAKEAAKYLDKIGSGSENQWEPEVESGDIFKIVGGMFGVTTVIILIATSLTGGSPA